MSDKEKYNIPINLGALMNRFMEDNHFNMATSQFLTFLQNTNLTYDDLSKALFLANHIFILKKLEDL